MPGRRSSATAHRRSSFRWNAAAISPPRAHRYLAGAEAALRDSMAIYADAVDQGALCNLRMELARFQGESGHGQRLFAQAITPQGVLRFR